MLRKVRIDSDGDTDLLPGELLEKTKYEKINSAMLAEGREPATASPVLLGIKLQLRVVVELLVIFPFKN